MRGPLARGTGGGDLGLEKDLESGLGTEPRRILQSGGASTSLLPESMQDTGLNTRRGRKARGRIWSGKRGVARGAAWESLSLGVKPQPVLVGSVCGVRLASSSVSLEGHPLPGVSGQEMSAFSSPARHRAPQHRGWSEDRYAPQKRLGVAESQENLDLVPMQDVTSSLAGAWPWGFGSGGDVPGPLLCPLAHSGTLSLGRGQGEDALP